MPPLYDPLLKKEQAPFENWQTNPSESIYFNASSSMYFLSAIQLSLIFDKKAWLDLSTQFVDTSPFHSTKHPLYKVPAAEHEKVCILLRSMTMTCVLMHV